MLVRTAKEIAHQWVQAEGSSTPGFAGAYLAGSITWMDDDATLPETSDVDVMVVLDGPVPAQKPGKFLYQGVLLEISFLPGEEVQTPEQILGHSQLAGGFRSPGILADPTGRLTTLQAAVARDYARRQWVYRRCEHTLDRIITGFQQLNASNPFQDQVMSWLFPTGITTHLLLVAGLINPTVRLRYLAARKLLKEYGRLDVYESLLELLGCARMEPAQVERHLATMTEAFDAATAVIKSPFPFASDITEQARPIAVDGSRELIARGDHREAVFWIAATYSRCHQVFYRDATSGIRERHSDGYAALLADLGIGSYLDLCRRAEQVTAALPALWRVAEAIIAVNPEVED